MAALAILTASLAPSLSYALGFSGGASWIEVCTTEGSRWIQPGEEGSERAPSSAHLLEHCPYCSLHVPTLGLPSAAPVAPLASRPTHEPPVAFLAAPRTLHAWVTAQPRAPPHAF